MRNFGFVVSGVGLFFIFGVLFQWFGWDGMDIALVFVGCAITITGAIISAAAMRNK